MDAQTGQTDAGAAPVTLGAQELRAMTLYASGHSIRLVAQAMGTTDETVKSYLKRGRRKYRDAGVDLGSRLLLRQHAIREGWLDSA